MVRTFKYSMRTTDHGAILRASAKFRRWRPRRAPANDRFITERVRRSQRDPVIATDRAEYGELRGRVGSRATAHVTETHYSPAQLAKSWGVSAQTIRNIFEAEPDVLRIPSMWSANGKRPYVSMKIPESVAARVHKRLSAVPR
jgi:hypothetical protein